MRLLPTPPKESIGGNKPRHQILDTIFADQQYNYLLTRYQLIESDDFTELDEAEQESITSGFDEQFTAYESLRLKIENY